MWRKEVNKKLVLVPDMVDNSSLNKESQIKKSDDEEDEKKQMIEEPKPVNLCENTDCERYPPDWDSE